MFNHLNRAIGIVNSFDRILETGPNPNLRQGNSLRFPNQANLQNFPELMHNGTEK